MQITGRADVETVTDILCDVCRCSTRLDGRNQFGTLQAR